MIPPQNRSGTRTAKCHSAIPTMAQTRTVISLVCGPVAALEMGSNMDSADAALPAIQPGGKAAQLRRDVAMESDAHLHRYRTFPIAIQRRRVCYAAFTPLAAAREGSRLVA